MCSYMYALYRVTQSRGWVGCHFAAFIKVAANGPLLIGLTCDRSTYIHTPYLYGFIQLHQSTMIRNLRPLLSKGASTSRRSLASTPVRALATPAIEGRSSPVRSHSVEE